ncbi:MAG: HlyD family efflux transporter periplasmic adaptor subunit [Bacteroidetes bacterium]|nr:HlyD family efflux transporter periplasmic adaptor subunit [Bacteroidota bacterium]
MTSFCDGYLVESRVHESDLVGEDQLLFSIDNRVRAAEEGSSMKSLDIARLNASDQSPVLQMLRSEERMAQKKLTRDSLQWVRMSRLFESQSVSRQDLDNILLQYQTDVDNLKSIRANLAATRLSLKQSLIQAESQYTNSNLNNQYYELRSIKRSRVYQVYKKPGEMLRKGEAVALLGNPDSLVVVIMMDESGISKVKVGQQVLVELNTNKGSTLNAHVSKIYPYFDNASQSYKVEASFDRGIENVIAGTLLQANIIVAKKDKALLIPRSSLAPDGSVTIKKEGDPIKTRVKTGVGSTEWVEVIDGLDEGDQVLDMF